MTAGFDTRTYLRDLALYALNNETGPVTAADLSEVMLSLAQNEGLLPSVCSETNPAAVAGCLRALENAGQAKRQGERKSGRHGRAEPTWVIAGERLKLPLPHPGMYEIGSDVRALPSGPGAILQVDDGVFLRTIDGELLRAVQRFMRDLDDIRLRHEASVQLLRARGD